MPTRFALATLLSTLALAPLGCDAEPEDPDVTADESSGGSDDGIMLDDSTGEPYVGNHPECPSDISLIPGVTARAM